MNGLQVVLRDEFIATPNIYLKCEKQGNKNKVSMALKRNYSWHTLAWLNRVKAKYSVISVIRRSGLNRVQRKMKERPTREARGNRSDHLPRGVYIK